MSKKIEDYLHLYLGCEASIAGHSSVIQGNITPITLERALNNECIIKPHLRPLSSMTEEEKINIALMFGVSYGDDITKKNATESLFERNGYFNKRTNITGSQWNNIINYCRRQCIDMDGLIESGIAIDKTKM